MAPRIETERLILRPLRSDDAVHIAILAGDADVARMTSSIPHPYPVEAAQGWIARSWGEARRSGTRVFAIVERDDESLLIGTFGVFRRSPHAAWEIGYWLGKPHWGRGYATEALAAILPWALAETGAQRLVAGHFDDNPASARVLAKAGFTTTGCSCSMFSLARGAKVRCVEMAWTPLRAAAAA